MKTNENDMKTIENTWFEAWSKRKSSFPGSFDLRKARVTRFRGLGSPVLAKRADAERRPS